MNKDRPLTRLQERLIKKLGAYAFPFYFEVPPHCPASVSLQPAPGDTGSCEERSAMGPHHHHHPNAVVFSDFNFNCFTFHT